MKHCPNPQCPGLEQFKAVSEFNDSAERCGDCGGHLVDGPAPDRLDDGRPEPDPDLELVDVLTVTNEADVMIVESLLAEAGIRYLARGEQIQDLFGIGRLVGVNPITGPVVFSVAADNAALARDLLSDFQSV